MLSAPTYGTWCDRKPNTVQESICLILGVQPETMWQKEAHDVDGFNPLAEAIEQYAELAGDALASGKPQPFTPAELARAPPERRAVPRQFLEWAKAWNIAIPEELIPLLAREPVPATPEVSVLERLGRGYLQQGADASSDAVGPTRTRRPPRGIS